jgi:hypothetical protein
MPAHAGGDNNHEVKSGVFDGDDDNDVPGLIDRISTGDADGDADADADADDDDDNNNNNNLPCPWAGLTGAGHDENEESLETIP